MTDHIPITHSNIVVNGAAMAVIDPHLTHEGPRYRVFLFAKEFDTRTEAENWAMERIKERTTTTP